MMFEENRDDNLKNGKSLGEINVWSTVPSKFLASANLLKYENFAQSFWEIKGRLIEFMPQSCVSRVSNVYIEIKILNALIQIRLKITILVDKLKEKFKKFAPNFSFFSNFAS